MSDLFRYHNLIYTIIFFRINHFLLFYSSKISQLQIVSVCKIELSAYLELGELGTEGGQCKHCGPHSYLSLLQTSPQHLPTKSAE